MYSYYETINDDSLRVLFGEDNEATKEILRLHDDLKRTMSMCAKNPNEELDKFYFSQAYRMWQMGWRKVTSG